MTWDLWQIEGPRLPWIALGNAEWRYRKGRDEGVFLLDFWIEGLGDWGDDTAWDPARAIWGDVERCVRQAEEMLALARTADQAARIHQQHIEGMRVVCGELKAAMQAAGVRFAA